MPAAIYARYSSENQRPESIDDQISECRKLAKQRAIAISDDHIYSDQAQSGARSDRPALAALWRPRSKTSSMSFSSTTSPAWPETTT
jgi:site-specific DNA recombinase